MYKSSLNRVSAIASKEWRLNLRFATEYFIGNFVTPVKSALVMILIYSGFFKASDIFLTSVTKENYIGYVLVGSILHSQFTNSAGLLSGKFVAEKYWQTALGTLLSPATISEVTLGYAIGSGGMTTLVNILLLGVVTFFFPISFSSFLMAVGILLLISALGYSLGLLGATIGLVWEGKLFLYHYGMQVLTFFSCLYYPIGVIPEALQPIVRWMPTYQIGEAMHNLYFGILNTNALFSVIYMLITTTATFLVAGYLYNSSIRKYGIVGY